MSYPMPTLDLLPSRDRQQTGSSISTKSIVIVDASANQYHYLFASSLDSMEVHILNEQEDGIVQILSLLQQYHHLSRLLLFCKGAPSRIELGTTILNEANLWIYADTIREWRNYFTHDAEIVIYACDLATTRMGQAFISWLGLLTRACVKVV